MMPAWHQLVPISGHVEESETARKLQLYATSIKTSVSTRLLVDLQRYFYSVHTGLRRMLQQQYGIIFVTGATHLHFYTYRFWIF